MNPEQHFASWSNAPPSTKPIAYLVGEKEFYSLSFQVSAAVLIPRAETEMLVEVTVDRLQGVEQPRILDMGTGSGCIAIALLTQIKDASALGDRHQR